jgi:hypothetical protein
MRQNLQLHPDWRCEALTGIDVEIARTRPAGLVVRFTAYGKTNELVLPPLRSSKRTDELWKSTCFEVFLRIIPEKGCREFNFSPSTEWAAYSFSNYREGAHDLPIAAPAISVMASEGELVLQVEMDLRLASDLLSNSVWRLGLSAIIEETSGRKSYWALKHPPGKPDFHHADCFALELPPP